MTDIVERLRALNPLDTDADEIESLRQQVELWKSNYLEQVELHNKTLDELARLEVVIKDFAQIEAGMEEELAELRKAQTHPKAMIVGLGREQYGLRWAGKDGEAYYKSKAAGHDVAPLYTSPSIPDGWQLVPIEPTKEMLWQIKDETAWYDPVGIYKKLLSAAPKP